MVLGFRSWSDINVMIFDIDADSALRLVIILLSDGCGLLGERGRGSGLIMIMFTLQQYIRKIQLLDSALIMQH